VPNFIPYGFAQRAMAIQGLLQHGSHRRQYRYVCVLRTVLTVRRNQRINAACASAAGLTSRTCRGALMNQYPEAPSTQPLAASCETLHRDRRSGVISVFCAASSLSIAGVTWAGSDRFQPAADLGINALPPGRASTCCSKARCWAAVHHT
jgi:hypothetical protein